MHYGETQQSALALIVSSTSKLGATKLMWITRGVSHAFRHAPHPPVRQHCSITLLFYKLGHQSRSATARNIEACNHFSASTVIDAMQCFKKGNRRFSL
eukprot:1140752-Pelagomonas_calceolata.AAC.5